MIGLKFWMQEVKKIHSYWTSRRPLTPSSWTSEMQTPSTWHNEKTLAWIDSFLCNRQQRVVVSGAKSQLAPVLSGVPQGTVLGPLLFSLHINGIMVGIESEIRLFAVGFVCYCQIDSIEDTLKLQKDIDQLGKWARRWVMIFQPVKC